MNLRFNGSQGTDQFYPLLPKSVVAIWVIIIINDDHQKSREKRKAMVIQGKIRSKRNPETGTDRQRQTDKYRPTNTDQQRHTDRREDRLTKTD